jgi:7-keto-8-aminopelargonate synthetase-like enzyme
MKALILGCRVTEFTHRDPTDLKKKVSSTTGRFAVLTDGMFSHDGSIAPLAEYRKVIGQNGLLWVDDAHAGGIIGKHGRGTVELEGISHRNVLQTVTFSKALGTYGGAILCDKKMAALISEKSCAVGGNTPAPLPLVAATLTALELCNERLRAQLFANIGISANPFRNAAHQSSRSPLRIQCACAASFSQPESTRPTLSIPVDPPPATSASPSPANIPLLK